MTEATATDPAGPAQQARALLQAGALDEARSLLEGALEQSPDDIEARYVLAVCLRLARDYTAAEAALEAILVREPENGRALQEAGHLARDRGRDNDALRYYGEAVRSNPALLASFRNRLELLRRAGREDEARATEAQLRIAEALPPPLLAATDLLAQGRMHRAEELCRAFLQKQPQHVEGMRLLAEIGMRLGALEEAEFLLETACELEPDNLRLRIELVRVLSKRQRFEASLAQAEELLRRAPDSLPFQSLRAIELLQLGRYDAAVAGFDAILKRLPGDAATLTSRGHALKTCGRSEEAINNYREAAERRHHGEAWYALANLKTYRFSDAQIDAMRRQAADSGQAHMDRVYLSFALGKAFEDREDYAAAFEHFDRGNSLRRRQLRYRAEQLRAEVDAQRELLDADLFGRLGPGGHDAPDPIFILGLPRAGSTLLEQILSAHSQIEGTRELPNILAMAQKLRRRRDEDGEQPGYPEILAHLDHNTRQELGRAYIEQTALHRSGTPFFIDKMPNNFRHIGLVHLILPRAKIIDARREPMACCFSNYQQLFAEGQEFSYDLGDLGQYYRDYERLMAHWDTALPGRVFRLQHERLLDDLEGELRRLFSYLELPFEEGCLRYWESDRAVRTPSSEQVRRPLFRDGERRWQYYEEWLGPLRDALALKPANAA
ncbi:MAG: sulfotransferase [Halieaceae bacterium]|nr:sulfotransferase [Halieaceae bacterium]